MPFLNYRNLKLQKKLSVILYLLNLNLKSEYALHVVLDSISMIFYPEQEITLMELQ